MINPYTLTLNKFWHKLNPAKNINWINANIITADFGDKKRDFYAKYNSGFFQEESLFNSEEDYVDLFQKEMSKDSIAYCGELLRTKIGDTDIYGILYKRNE